jgi:hypothetical protein
MIRGAAVAAVVLTLAACGGTEEPASPRAARVHTAEEVAAAFAEHDVKTTRRRLDTAECGDDAAAYEYGRGDDFEKVGVSCTAFVIAPEGSPLPTDLLTPVERHFLVLVYASAADAARVETRAPEADASALFGTPLEYLRRDNVLVVCARCGADRALAQAALDDL